MHQYEIIIRKPYNRNMIFECDNSNGKDITTLILNTILLLWIEFELVWHCLEMHTKYAHSLIITSLLCTSSNKSLTSYKCVCVSINTYSTCYILLSFSWILTVIIKRQTRKAYSIALSSSKQYQQITRKQHIAYKVVAH